jgi:putative FmdB family regulatory protein
MPEYLYKCECGYRYSEVRNIEDRNSAICPECGETVTQDYSKKDIRIDSDVLREPDGKLTGYNVGLGLHVDSKSEMKRIAQLKGLEWIGDDPIPKVEPKRVEPDWNAVAQDLDKMEVA